MTNTGYHLVDVSRRSRWPTPREWIAGIGSAAGAAAGAILGDQSIAVVILFAVGAAAAVVGGLKGRGTT